MSRVPPPLPPSKRSLNRAQGDLSDTELAALLPPESDDDEEHPQPPPLPGKTVKPPAAKASAIPPPLPPGTAKGATTVAPPPLPGSAGVVSHVPPPVWGKEEFDPEETDSKPQKPTGLTEQQKSLLYLLGGSFFGAVVLIVLLVFVFKPRGDLESGGPAVQIEMPSNETTPTPIRRGIDLNAPDVEFIESEQ